jgi:23S rRNA pseudouridine2605 synthase
MGEGDPVRVQVYLARRTGLSRRAAEAAIRDGRVAIDGEPCTLGTKVVPGEHRVELDGAVVEAARPALAWRMLHKPRRVVTTRSDERGRRTVTDLLGPEHAALFPVGRLDAATTGLLLLTTDGELANRLLHPSRHVEKTYQVILEAALSRRAARRLQAGTIELDGRAVQPAELEELEPGRYALTIREGRNRQVRRMFEEVGAAVKKLHRTRFGPLVLGDLARGSHRALTPAEVEALREVAGG